MSPYGAGSALCRPASPAGPLMVQVIDHEGMGVRLGRRSLEMRVVREQFRMAVSNVIDIT